MQAILPTTTTTVGSPARISASCGHSQGGRSVFIHRKQCSLKLAVPAVSSTSATCLALCGRRRYQELSRISYRSTLQSTMGYDAFTLGASLFIGGIAFYLVAGKALGARRKQGKLAVEAQALDEKITRQGFTAKKVPDDLDVVIIGSGIGGGYALLSVSHPLRLLFFPVLTYFAFLALQA